MIMLIKLAEWVSKEGAPFLRPSGQYMHSLKEIRRRHVDDDALVVIDVSIWIVSGLTNAKSVNAFHLVPPVPVVHTANYVRDRINVLRKARFEPVLVFDGQRNTAKAGENERRLSAHQAIEQQLTTAYEQGTKSMSDINKLRAKATYVREDVLFEVLQMARSEKIRVVRAPFESDHQLHALQVQGIVDYVLSDDSDIPYLGCRSTIMRMSLNGKCCLVERDVLLNETFPKLFEIRRPQYTRSSKYMNLLRGIMPDKLFRFVSLEYTVSQV